MQGFKLIEELIHRIRYDTTIALPLREEMGGSRVTSVHKSKAAVGLAQTKATGGPAVAPIAGT